MTNEQQYSYEFCLVGRFLTYAVLKFDPMRNTLADVLKPLGGVSISDLNSGRCLFRFFYEVDIQRVISGGPWMFNNNLLITHRLHGVTNQRRWILIHACSGCKSIHSRPGVDRRQWQNSLGTSWSGVSKQILWPPTTTQM